MPNVGPLELGILLVVVLLFFGAKRLPEFGRGMGRGLREFGQSVTGADEREQVGSGEELAGASAKAAPAPDEAASRVE